MTDDQCLDAVQSMLMKTIKSKATPEKDKRAAGSELLKLLTIKNKIKVDEDDNFFAGKPR